MGGAFEAVAWDRVRDPRLDRESFAAAWPTAQSAKIPPLMATTTSTRADLVAALETDLIGPFEENEVLHLPPSRWYLTGFLAAMDARTLAEPDDDELAAGSDLDAEEAGPAEGGPKSRHFLPASLGLSVLLPPAGTGPDNLVAIASWADYRAEDAETDEGATGFDPQYRRRRNPKGKARPARRSDCAGRSPPPISDAIHESQLLR